MIKRLKLSNLLLLLSFSTRKHMSVASRTILSNFFEEQCPQSHPQYLSGLSRALFPTTFLDLPPVLTSPQSRLKHAYRPPFVQPPPLGKKSEKGCFFSLREERLAGLGAYIVGPRNPRPNGSRLKGVYVN